MSDTGVFTSPPDRRSRLESPRPTNLAKSAPGGLNGILGRLEHALDRVDTRQTASLNAMEESYDSKTRRMRGVLAELGLGLGKPTADGVGGPFVPFKLSSHATAFEKQVYRIQVARAQVDRLTKTLATVPIRKPVTGEIDMSSGFGMRIDPFLGRPAMHTGLDFRGEIGDAIRATAGGVVVSAGWSGGYGRMVEIEHGHGLSTRYGHLSEIDVRVGQAVKTGQIVGRLGSTGRSTGPHLHYETRVEGDAVDPQKFLRAGTRMGML
jgi:murein DD-endopeptidase MepM/ murein hydrolase activator NlpD